MSQWTIKRIIIAAGIIALAAVAFFLVRGPASGPYEPKLADGDRVLALTQALSTDDMRGRETGTPDAAAARALIKEKFVSARLQAYQLAYEHAFMHGPLDDPDGQREGINLVGRIDGKSPDGPVMVVSAHYDHLPVDGDDIYNGADDNASGVAALVAIAEWFQDNPPDHTIIFAAFDAEETGLAGARDFVRNPPVPLEQIALNLNLDMVARADRGELYVVGTYHTPALVPLIEEIAKDAPLTLLMGHDRPEDGDQDWTLLSDHGPFHRAGKPFIYFGVEDHPDYHQPSDTFDKIDPEAFLRSVETIVMAAHMFDQRLEDIAAMTPNPEPSDD